MRIYMQSIPEDEGDSLRFYHIMLQQDLLGGWTVIRESGRQGARGRVQREHFEAFDAAENALQVTRDKQLKRGYRVVFAEGMQQGVR